MFFKNVRRMPHNAVSNSKVAVRSTTQFTVTSISTKLASVEQKNLDVKRMELEEVQGEQACLFPSGRALKRT